MESRPGHPPADPRILPALWLYATVQGIGGAREPARLCAVHIAFRWRCGGVGMNAKTLADFQVTHGAVLEQVLVSSFTALLTIDAAKLDRVAQDGVRVRAAAGAGAASFRRHSMLEVGRQEAEERVRRRRASGWRRTAHGASSRRWQWPKPCAPSSRSGRASVPSGTPGNLPLPGLPRQSPRNPSRRQRKNRGTQQMRG
ncbi:MAG TPA: hypothetical protein VND19_15340 [Acetobacteraceae bacterium]|nr:hypothetical protein [Acetobacteraceae bacterium]